MGDDDDLPRDLLRDDHARDPHLRPGARLGMRVLLATLALVVLVSCDGADEESVVVDGPPPVESPITPRVAPREVPELCQALWDGLHDRGGIVTPHSDERRYAPTTLAEARHLLETTPSWTGAWAPGASTDEGRAYHRLRESPDALAHFEHLYRSGPERVPALYAACGFAELDRDRYAEVLRGLRASEATVSASSGDVVSRVRLADLIGDGVFGRLFVTPGGFVGARRDDGLSSGDPGHMQIVQSLDPFVPGGDASLRDVSARRIVRAIESDDRLTQYIPQGQLFGRSWRANIEVRGDALDVQLLFADRERFAVRFTVDRETGEARDIRETRW